MYRYNVSHFASLTLLLIGGVSNRLIAEPPTISHCYPQAVVPGRQVEISLHGERLSNVTKLWTSFPAIVQRVEEDLDQPDRERFLITTPRQLEIGIGALRVVTSQGASRLRLIMIDDIQSTAGDRSHYDLASAQSVTHPIAIDGNCSKLKSNFYAFDVDEGRSLSVEVVAQRLGSPLDSVIRLLDSSGHELAHNDDDLATGADSRLTFTPNTRGRCILEVRDVRYRGGEEFRYRIRLGDFPLVSVPYPLSGPAGNVATFSILGPATDAVLPVTVLLPKVTGRMQLGVENSAGATSGFITVMSDALPQAIEHEPNDRLKHATPVETPIAIHGRFETSADRDYFQLEVEEQTRLTFQATTRTLGSPTDLFMRILGPSGERLAEVDDKDGNDGQIDHRFASAGIYYLMVEELTRQGSPEHAYRIAVEPHRPRLRLEVDQEVFNVPRGGTFVAKITANRHDVVGPIQLAVEGVDTSQWIIKNNVIPKGKNETTIDVTLPNVIPPGTLLHARIRGTVGTEDKPQFAIASTMPGLRNIFPDTPFLPATLDGVMSLAVSPEFPPFFELAIVSQTILFPRLVGNSSFQIQIKRINKGFKSSIKLQVEGLPDGMTANVQDDKNASNKLTVQLSGPETLPVADHELRLVGRATFENQTQQFELDNVLLRIAPPLDVQILPAGPIAIGESQKLKIRVKRFGQSHPVEIRWIDAPAGLLVPLTVEVPADQDEVEIQLHASSDARAGRYSNVVVLAETQVNGKTVTVKSAPATIEFQPR